MFLKNNLQHGRSESVCHGDVIMSGTLAQLAECLTGDQAIAGCCTLLYVNFSIAIILMGKRELIALHNLSSWCLVMVERLFLRVPRGCLQFVIVVFPDHTHLLFFLFACDDA